MTSTTLTRASDLSFGRSIPSQTTCPLSRLRFRAARHLTSSPRPTLRSLMVTPGTWFDLTKELGSSFLKQFFPSANALYSSGDSQYGIGWEAQMFGLFCNAQLLQKAKLDIPETWDDVIASAPALHKRGLVPVALTGDPNTNAVDFFLPLVTQASNDPNLCSQLDLLTEPGVSWNSQPVIEAFKMFETLARARVFEPNVNAVISEEALALFFHQKAAMLSAGSSAISSLASFAKRDFNRLYEVAMWPAWKSGATHWSAGQAQTGWSVNKRGNVDAALTFLKWLYQPERYAALMGVTDFMPATEDAAAKASDHRQRLMASWMPHTGCYHILTGTGSETAVGNVLGTVLNGKLSPTGAAAAVEAQVKAIRRLKLLPGTILMGTATTARLRRCVAKPQLQHSGTSPSGA